MIKNIKIILLSLLIYSYIPSYTFAMDDDENFNSPLLTPGRYSDAFQNEVRDNRCRNLICYAVLKGSFYTTEVDVEIGTSVTGNITTKHYKKEPTRVSGLSHYECEYCKARFPNFAKVEVGQPDSASPRVTINRKGTNWEMTVSEGSLHSCQKPRLKGDLLEIWNKAKKMPNEYLLYRGLSERLKVMMEAAGQLDELDTSIVYTVNTSSSCCCIIQ